MDKITPRRTSDAGSPRIRRANRRMIAGDIAPDAPGGLSQEDVRASLGRALTSPAVRAAFQAAEREGRIHVRRVLAAERYSKHPLNEKDMIDNADYLVDDVAGQLKPGWSR